MSAANKAWYWVAAGVLALGLNGYYQDGGLTALHRAAERSTLAVAEARAQFTQVATLAEVAVADQALSHRDRQAPAVVALAPVMVPSPAQVRLVQVQQRLATLQRARVQVRIARLQQVIARHQMERGEVEIQNGRLTVLTNEGHVRVDVPTLPQLEVTVPQEPAIAFMPN